MKSAIGRPEPGLDRTGARLRVRAACSHGALEIHENAEFRWLEFGDGVVQSAMRLARPAELVLAYTRAMTSFLLFAPAPATVWMLGVGGGSLLRFLRAHRLARGLVGVDSDAAVIEAAHAHFEIPRADAGLALRTADARTALAAGGGEAPAVILVDLFGPGGMVAAAADPLFHAACRERLAPRGVLVLNTWVADAAGFLALAGDLREVFEGRVLCLPVDGYRNLILLAFRSPPELLRLDGLRRRASALQSRLGIDYPGAVRRLAHNNLTGGGELIL